MRQFSLILFLSFYALSSLLAQHLPGELIIQLAPVTQAKKWQAQWNKQQPGLQIDRQLSRPANIWLFRFDPNTDSDAAQKLLQSVRQDRNVISAQFNHTVELRSTPNDPLYDTQWWLNNTDNPAADLNAEAAWDITTGGLTALGDTIVVAVIDNGVDLQHEDLQRNLWVNHAEIPNNGMDDDNNGYVDDYRGWNILTNDDDVSGGGHGTPVAGIVGADGDNGIGVAGVNWNVKLMIVKNNFASDEARVLEAYSYPLEQRIRYNESGGQEGAFVVATNASWGRKLTFASEAPVWCSFYDFLGQHGIINAGATANEEVDVDVLGDLPTTCSSDFLISVTNLNRNNERVNPSGFGTTSIDLGAYGDEVPTTSNGNAYRDFRGTSAATPMVAGAAALLYSIDCPTLLNLTQSDPAAAALLIREAILESATPTSSLAGITTTGGRLNLRAAIEYLTERCQGCIAASSVREDEILDISTQILWNTNDSLQQVDLRWRQVGDTDWQVLTDVSSPFILDGLTACTDYEYELRSICTSETIPFGNRQTFQTEGCCVAPEPLPVSNLGNTSARLNWNAVFTAIAYEVRYRAVGVNEWTIERTTNTNLLINELTTCTTYEYELRTDCGGEFTPWSAVSPFTTLGCGPCLDLAYCIPDDMNPESEYIQRVEFPGLFTNTSTRPTEGYTDFGTSVGLITMEQGATYPFELTQQYVAQEFDDAWRIWIDFDHNGLFTSNEIVYTSPGASRESVQGNLQIPADARLGLTRMRIMLRFLSVGNACPFGDGNFGEVEDYCVEIIPSSVCSPPGNLTVSERSFSTVTLNWATVGPAVSYNADFRAFDQVEWQPVGNLTTESLTLSGLDTCTAYLVRVKSICATMESEDYRDIEFTTECVSNTSNIPGLEAKWSAYPNPVKGALFIEAMTNNFPAELQLKVYNSLGQCVTTNIWQTQGLLQLNTQQWEAGLYTLTLWQGGRLWSSKKVIK